MNVTPQATVAGENIHILQPKERSNDMRQELEQQVEYCWLQSPIGTLRLAATASGLQEIAFAAEEPVRRPLHEAWVEGSITPPQTPAAEWLARTTQQLEQYFAGERRTFELQLAPHGTDFQHGVWKLLCDIPFGATTSYGEVARRLGRPTASRAVGAANGANPIPIIVPCHRVVGSNGTLTGYAGGLPTKEFLLELESDQHSLAPSVG